MRAVIRQLSLRMVELVVLLFAVLGFFFVPLGQRTAFDHVRAVLATPAAADAGRELSTAVSRIGGKVRELLHMPSPSEDAAPQQMRVTPQARASHAPRAAVRDAGGPDVSLE